MGTPALVIQPIITLETSYVMPSDLAEMETSCTKPNQQETAFVLMADPHTNMYALSPILCTYTQVAHNHPSGGGSGSSKSLAAPTAVQKKREIKKAEQEAKQEAQQASKDEAKQEAKEELPRNEDAVVHVSGVLDAEVESGSAATETSVHNNIVEILLAFPGIASRLISVTTGSVTTTTTSGTRYTFSPPLAEKSL